MVGEQENHRIMKILILSAGLALALAAAAGAQEPAPVTVDRVRQDVQELEDQLQQATAAIESLQERLAAVEKQLGEPPRFGSSLDTVESRLEDLEKELKRR